MSEKKDGGHAFPSATTADMAGMKIVTGMSDGMTLRDWFAGMVLAGINVDPDYESSPEDRAKWAYFDADAMIAERDK